MSMPISKIYVDPEAFSRYKYLESLADGEISAMGKVTMIRGAAYIHDIVLLKQKCTGSETEIDPAAIGKALFNLREVDGTLSCWIHSHDIMGVFWSSTDYEQMADFSLNGYVISIVTNNDGETKCAYCHGGNAQVPAMFVDDIEIVFGKPMSPEDAAELDAQFEELVTEIKPKIVSTRTSIARVHHGDDEKWTLTWYIGCGIPFAIFNDVITEYFWDYGVEPKLMADLVEYYPTFLLNGKADDCLPPHRGEKGNGR